MTQAMKNVIDALMLTDTKIKKIIRPRDADAEIFLHDGRVIQVGQTYYIIYGPSIRRGVRGPLLKEFPLLDRDQLTELFSTSPDELVQAERNRR